MPRKSASEINWPLSRKISGKFSKFSTNLYILWMKDYKIQYVWKEWGIGSRTYWFFFSFFLGDNYGRQTGKYDAKNARLANQVPGFTGA